MSIGLDTSVIVHLLVGEPKQQALAAHRFLDEMKTAGQGPVLVSELVISEAFFALRHHYAVPAAAALQALKALSNDERIRATPAALRVLATPNLATAKPGFLDRLIHGHYLESGVGMATFDKAAGRLPDTRVLTI